jgi:flagellar biosynthetic protein FlhB
MSKENDLERTEPASERRITQAREEGDVPRSLDAASAIVLAGVGGMLWLFGPHLIGGFSKLIHSGLFFDQRVALDAAALMNRLQQQSQESLMLLLPILCVGAIGALMAPFSTGGWVFAAKRLAPQWSRVNPISGFARLVSLENFAEFAKTLVKAVLISAVAAIVLALSLGGILSLTPQALPSGLKSLTNIAAITFFSIAAAVAAIAVLDSPLQMWKWHRKLRMSREELRREAKEQEGDPHVKARIRQQQREVARRRMMADVPTADVVVTNPTHYAVALKYQDGKMRAPRVVAKGLDHVAAKIRSVALENRVPLLEAPSLARALYSHAEVGEEIPGALYATVAEVLAYVYQLRDATRHGLASPALPKLSNIPAGLDPAESAEGLV